MNKVEIDILKVLGDKETFYFEGELLLHEKLKTAIGHNTLSYQFNIGIVRCPVIHLGCISMDIFDRKHLLNKKYQLKRRIGRVPNYLLWRSRLIYD